MKITKEDVLYVADLARLELDEAAVDRFAHQIAEILDYVDTLNSVDTTDVAPTSHAISLTNAFREDSRQAHLNREAALENAPQQDGGEFMVPKIIS